MKPGDVAAMPADIRHQGYAPKRSMLLVWENADPELPALHLERQAAVDRRSSSEPAGRGAATVAIADRRERACALQDRLFIGGEFVDAARRGDVRDARTRTTARSSPRSREAGAGGRRPGRRRGRGGVPGVVAAAGGGARPAAAEAGRPDRGRRRRARAARDRSTPATRSATAAASTCRAPRRRSATSAAWPTSSRATSFRSSPAS